MKFKMGRNCIAGLALSISKRGNLKPCEFSWEKPIAISGTDLKRGQMVEIKNGIAKPEFLNDQP